MTADQGIFTGSLSAGSFSATSGDIGNITGDVLTITGSANVGGLVASGSVRNTSNGATTSVLMHAYSGSTTLFQVLTDGEVLARDNITAFKTSGFSSISDKRLKTDIQPISQSLDKILKLEPTNFSWIENNEKDSKLTIYLVDAIKELTKRVEELEKENKTLEVD